MTESLCDLPPALILLRPVGKGSMDLLKPCPALRSQPEPGGLGARPHSQVSGLTLAGRSGRVLQPLSAGMEGRGGIAPVLCPGRYLPRGLLQAGPGCLSSPGPRRRVWGPGRGWGEAPPPPAGCEGTPGARPRAAAISGWAAPPATRGRWLPVPSRPVPPAPPGAARGRGGRPGPAPPAAALAAQPEAAGQGAEPGGRRRREGGAAASARGGAGTGASSLPPARPPRGPASPRRAARRRVLPASGGSGGAPRGGRRCCPIACWTPTWWTWRSGGTPPSTT